MEELAEKPGETVNQGVLVKEKIYNLKKISNDDPIRVELQVGCAVPAYCTGMGKAILACLPSKKQKKLLSRIGFEQMLNVPTISHFSIFPQYRKGGEPHEDARLHREY
jgi:DNA-binding IclR family transcriptional regulator